MRTLANLRVDPSTGDPAPHKPLLLLVVFDLAQQDLLTNPLPLTPELAFRFCTFWSVVAHRRPRGPEVRLPFHHLGGDHIWTPLSADMTPSPHRRLTCFAQMTPEFIAFAHDPARREAARRLLVETYFEPEERIALYSMLGMRIPSDEEVKKGLIPFHDAVEKGREARFRLLVVAAYNYTCALTGYRLVTIDAGSIVDAAHIHPFSDSRDNNLRNGIALCKNAHWLFDQGLWTIDDDYRVRVATGRFSEDCPDGRALAEYEGLRLRLPVDNRLWPNPKNLAWHRKRWLQGVA